MRREEEEDLRITCRNSLSEKMVFIDADFPKLGTDSLSLSQKSLSYKEDKMEELVQPNPFNKDIIFQKTKEICTCTPRMVSNCFLNLFPVLRWVPRYNIKKQFLGDIVSGVALGIIAIPISIAYSKIVHVDAVVGLYTNFFCRLVYTIFATSHHSSVGTYGVLCLMVGDSVSKHLKAAGFDTETAILHMNSSLATNGTAFCDSNCYALKIATSLTFLVGVFQIIFWIFQLGFISIYLSEPLLSGFVTGASLTILTAQIQFCLGLHVPGHNGAGALVLTWIEIFTYIKDTNICDLITSIVAFAVIMPVKVMNDRYKSKLKIPIPVEFVVIVVATLLSHYLHFNAKYKSNICGAIRTGFQPPTAPDVSVLPSLVADAFPIAIVSYAMTVSLAEIFSKKHGYTVRANQEMLAIGMSNFIPSFFSAFAVCPSLAKTLFKESTGGHSQVSSVFTALVLMLVILAIAPLFYSLQISILGTIIVTSLMGALQKYADTPNMWRRNKIDTIIWWVSMSATALISTELGLLVAVCFSLLCVIFRTQRPRATLLAKVSDTEIYEDRYTYKDLTDIPNVKIFRFETFLYYANAGYFRSMLYEKTDVNPSKVAALQRKARKAEEVAVMPRFIFPNLCIRPRRLAACSMPKIDMHCLIIDCGAIQFVDSVGLSMIKEVKNDYEAIGVLVFLANCNPSVRSSLINGGYFPQCETGGQPEKLVFRSINEAVQFAEIKYRQRQVGTELIISAICIDQSQVPKEETEEQTDL